MVAQRSGRVYLFGLEKAAGAYVRRDGDERGEEEREGMRRGEERRGERRREEREGGKEERRGGGNRVCGASRHSFVT